jgi:lysine decarboxylase
VWTVPDGPAAQRALEEQGIFPEMSDRGHVVFILTCQDGPAEVERLERAMKHVKVSTKNGGTVETLPPPLPIPTAALSPRQALFAPRERVVLAEAEGRIAACQIAPYPPGIPVLAPGEVIEKKYLAYLGQIGYNINEETEVVQNG